MAFPKIEGWTTTGVVDQQPNFLTNRTMVSEIWLSPEGKKVRVNMNGPHGNGTHTFIFLNRKGEIVTNDEARRRIAEKHGNAFHS